MKKFKNAIGWSIGDIRAITLAICINKINLEDDVKPMRETQRRLKLITQEVVKTEILKLLKVGVIYTINDTR